MNNQETQSAMNRRRFLGRMASMTFAATCLPALSRLSQAAPKAGNWKDGFELFVNFEINQPGGTRYHRPFVAVWIEDANGQSVRTLCLWVQSGGRGPR